MPRNDGSATKITHAIKKFIVPTLLTLSTLASIAQTTDVYDAILRAQLDSAAAAITNKLQNSIDKQSQILSVIGTVQQDLEYAGNSAGYYLSAINAKAGNLMSILMGIQSDEQTTNFGVSSKQEAYYFPLWNHGAAGSLDVFVENPLTVSVTNVPNVWVNGGNVSATIVGTPTVDVSGEATLNGNGGEPDLPATNTAGLEAQITTTSNDIINVVDKFTTPGLYGASAADLNNPKSLSDSIALQTLPTTYFPSGNGIGLRRDAFGWSTEVSFAFMNTNFAMNISFDPNAQAISPKAAFLRSALLVLVYLTSFYTIATMISRAAGMQWQMQLDL